MAECSATTASSERLSGIDASRQRLKRRRFVRGTARTANTTGSPLVKLAAIDSRSRTVAKASAIASDTLPSIVVCIRLREHRLGHIEIGHDFGPKHC